MKALVQNDRRRRRERKRKQEGNARRRAAIQRAELQLQPVLDLVNAHVRKDVKTVDRVGWQLVYSWVDPDTPRDVYTFDAEEKLSRRDPRGGAVTALSFLKRWDRELAEKLIKHVQLQGPGRYVVCEDGAIELRSARDWGSIAELAALRIGRARYELRGIDGEGFDSFARRVKVCDNPTCEKWFFDSVRGTRKCCCGACNNRHQQLKLSPDYPARRKARDYSLKQCGSC